MDEKIVESWLAEIQQVIHSIGLAACAKAEASLMVYLEHILGVTSGRGLALCVLRQKQVPLMHSKHPPLTALTLCGSLHHHRTPLGF